MCKWLWEVLKEFVHLLCNWACSLTYPALGKSSNHCHNKYEPCSQGGEELVNEPCSQVGEELGSEPCFQTREELGNEACFQAGLGTSIVP